jgi:ADP-ribosylglycohydrolase
MPQFDRIIIGLREYARLKCEYGADPAALERVLEQAMADIRRAIGQILDQPDDKLLAAREPNDLDEIMALRPAAARILWPGFDQDRYRDRLSGAFLGRMAGCTLGAPVEFWSTDEMHDWASWIGDAFPPVDYWSAAKTPGNKRYGVSPFQAYTRSGMDGVPVDDDITYTILGLLIAEDCGLDFSVNDVGRCWLRYLPHACTAEDIALKNLKAGLAPEIVADQENPFVQWIGADIRSDPWGYLAPGLPERSARMAWQDAWISHRRNGIFGEMYFSAVIAAAFACDKPLDALALGLNEIPRDCLLAEDIRWALATGHTLSDYREARQAVQERFGDMSGVHTNLNACLTVFGLMIGQDDFTRCIGETVAMGYDNDCTAATVGSIFGAAYGLAAIPVRWHQPFHNKVLTYLNGYPQLAIDDVLRRFERLARRQFAR